MSTGGKVKVPAYITNESLDRLRNTVVALQGDDPPAKPARSATLTSFVQAAITAAMKQAKEKHNGGRAFPRTAQGAEDRPANRLRETWSS
ncbi:hypothetical protein [Streptomyces sp. NPDC026092]|uniref:hypothetical protein n=1 Tax=Streptomyces sp. NPDC026092 TaxID=3154797 RepID=UPI0033FAD53C